MARWCIVGSLTIGLIALAILSSLEPPSDVAMTANLMANRATFDRLLAMIQEDRGLLRVDVDWTDPADPEQAGISPARIAEYRRLMQAIGVTRGFSADEKRHGIHFIAWASGLSTRGRSKAYVWSSTGKFEDAQVASSLDETWRDGGRHVWAYRHLDGPWYLYLRRD